MFVGRGLKWQRQSVDRVCYSPKNAHATNFGFVARFSSNFQLVTQQICCDTAILDAHQANQPISVLHFFNPQQMFLSRDKLILQGEKRDLETSTKNLKQNNVARQV